MHAQRKARDRRARCFYYQIYDRKYYVNGFFCVVDVENPFFILLLIIILLSTQKKNR